MPKKDIKDDNENSITNEKQSNSSTSSDEIENGKTAVKNNNEEVNNSIKEEKVQIKNKRKYKKRLQIVLLFALFTAVIAYVLFRGTYLETLEIGEEYISVFWQNVKYMSITLITNFVLIYIIMYYTNTLIKIYYINKKGLK